MNAKDQAAAELRKILGTPAPNGGDLEGWIRRAARLEYWTQILVGESA